MPTENKPMSAENAMKSDPNYPEPTEQDLLSSLFETVWQAIKGWDISRYNDGIYSGPTGNDVMHIINAIKQRDSQICEAALREAAEIAGLSIYFGQNQQAIVKAILSAINQPKPNP